MEETQRAQLVQQQRLEVRLVFYLPACLPCLPFVPCPACPTLPYIYVIFFVCVVCLSGCGTPNE